MSTIHPSPFLRNVLLLDAAASGATAALLIAGAGLLDGLLGLPVALMREAGLILVPYVAFVGLGRHPRRASPAALCGRSSPPMRYGPWPASACC